MGVLVGVAMGLVAWVVVAIVIMAGVECIDEGHRTGNRRLMFVGILLLTAVGAVTLAVVATW